ncbi:hypothetical protein Ct9H90mP29_17270 [bacterium]|nr:MAG: hypothetical protein Ct9H90mP29_17270 [bacterium]
MGLSLKPLADRVVVEPAPAEDKSAGGIILPDTAQEKPQQGTVVAAGPGKVSDAGSLIEMTVKEGDKFSMENIPVAKLPLMVQNM